MFSRPISCFASAIVFAASFVSDSRGVSGQDQPLDPKIGEWRYPHSKDSGGGSIERGNGPVVFSQKNNSMYTEDSIDDVVRYYEKRTGFSLTPEKGPGSASGEASNGASVHIQDDSKDRRLTLRIFEHRTRNQVITLVISRAEGEKSTHIYFASANF